MQIIFIITILFIVIIIYNIVKRKRPLPQPDASKEKSILQQHVLFYQKLDAEEKNNFENRVQHFL